MRERLRPPREYVAAGGRRPEGPFIKIRPPGLLVLADAVIRIRAWMETSGRSVADVVADTELSRSTLGGLLSGRVWPQPVTLERLAAGSEIRLLPTHRI